MKLFVSHPPPQSCSKTTLIMRNDFRITPPHPKQKPLNSTHYRPTTVMPAQAGIHDFPKTTEKPNTPNHLKTTHERPNNPEHSTSMN
jgi:hypothetical protein